MVEYLLSAFRGVLAIISSVVDLLPTQNLLTYAIIAYILVLAIPIILFISSIFSDLRSVAYRKP